MPSTSRLHGIGKERALKKICDKKSGLYECAAVFSDPRQTVDIIVSAGEKAICSLYESNSGTTDINAQRCRILTGKVTRGKNFVDPESLPPSASAARFHSLRVFYQTMVFIGQGKDLNPIDWGWRLDTDKYLPITMTIHQPQHHF